MDFRILVIALFGAAFAVIMRKLRRLQDVVSTQDGLNATGVQPENLIKLQERVDGLHNRLEPLERLKRVVEQLPVPHPFTDKERGRLEHARDLLREAARVAKSVEEAGGDLDKTSNQAWITMAMGMLVSKMFSFDVYREFGNYQEGREKKHEQHGHKLTGRQHMVEMGDYLEKLAGRLNFEDIDPEATLPNTFADYLKEKCGERGITARFDSEP